MRTSFRTYHEATKHTPARLRRYARSLDWANMPNPYRLYAGVPVLDLPAAPPPVATAWDVLRGRLAPSPALDGPALLSQLLFHSAAVSATKRAAASTYSLRVNPSSGNLHPTEFHFVSNGLPGWPDGLYHYRPAEHAVEHRATDKFGFEAPLTFVLTSIAWREAWKYRFRAYRYCLLDTGHAAEALRFAALAAGLPGEFRGDFDDTALAGKLNLPADEWPLALVTLGAPTPAVRQAAVLPAPRQTAAHSAPAPAAPPPSVGTVPALASTPGAHPIPATTPDAPAIAPDDHATVAHPTSTTTPAAPTAPPPSAGTAPAIAPDAPAASPLAIGTAPAGTPNALSDRPRVPGIIERIHAVTSHPGPPYRQPFPGSDAAPLGGPPFAAVARARRSALDFEGGSRTIPLHALLALLSLAQDLPHLALYAYVHRVEGLAPGIYLLAAGELRQLRAGDQRVAAAGLSLGQDLAGNAAVAFSILGDLEGAAAQYGERAYRYVHFEAGALGQRLYLAAEALGLRGTGIGAFFDDRVHEYLGHPPGQVVYHFAVGYPVPDPRLAA